MKKHLRLGFADTCSTQFFVDTLSTRFDIIIDNDKPDFLIFGDENFGTTNTRFSKNDCIKIFHTGENRRPENYDCHYALSFDHTFEPWHYRLPGWALVPFGYKKYPFTHIFAVHQQKEPKSKFCVFIHRNPSNQLRNHFFNELSKYKKVDAAGPLFNNIGHVIGSDYDAKLDFIKDYKFVLAFENSSYPGYVTEKIMDGFYVNSIPVYWGSPTVGLDFNTEAFLNAHDFGTVENLINRIIEIDKDDELYYNMTAQPKFRHNIAPYPLVYDNYLNWFESIVYNKRYHR